MRKSLLAIFVLAFCSFLFSQQAMNNDAVVKLVKAGLSDDLIVSTINASPGAYDTSADAIIALKSAGASDKVVAAVVARAAAPAAPVSRGLTAEPATPDPNDPMSQHDPGIYLYTKSHDGKVTMTLIERAGAGREKTANIWGSAFTYGISKAKMKAEIPGLHAPARTEDMRPVFYMYFPPTGNLGSADTISSPSQFSLLSLEVKKDHRETTVAKMGLASASVGNDVSREVKFDSQKIRPYSYKVAPQVDLKPGEYAFIAASGSAGAASATSVVIYDFGVDGK
jgi:hypothetical protein